MKGAASPENFFVLTPKVYLTNEQYDEIERQRYGRGQGTQTEWGPRLGY